jgi:hypothetical protein
VFDLVTKTDANGLSYTAIANSDSAIKYAGYVNPNSLKAGSAFDVDFPAINRENDTVTIEYDVIWDQLTSGGQNGRVVVGFLHDQPQRKAQFGDFDSVNAVAPFARPAYSVRIFNRLGGPGNNYANMMYGGGKDTLGEFEKYGTGGTTLWWLPGFISGPGGVSPEGFDEGYPLNRTGARRFRARSLGSTSRWNHFKLKLMPERMEFYYRASGGSTDTLAMFQSLPKPGTVAAMLAKINADHGTSITDLPILYNYFPVLKGVRVFFNAQNKTYFANLKVTTSGDTLVNSFKPEYKTFIANVWPNPAEDVLNAECSERLSHVAILDSRGKTELQKRTDLMVETLNVKDLPKGAYALVLTTAFSGI